MEYLLPPLQGALISLTWRCCKCGRIVFRSGDMNFSTPIEIRCCHITYTFFTDIKGSIHIAFGERGLERGEIIPPLSIADIEAHYKCKATWIASVPFKEECDGGTIWEGQVEVFHLDTYYPAADRCFSWFIEGKRYVTALPSSGSTYPTRDDICEAFLARQHDILDKAATQP